MMSDAVHIFACVSSPCVHVPCMLYCMLVYVCRWMLSVSCMVIVALLHSMHTTAPVPVSNVSFLRVCEGGECEEYDKGDSDTLVVFLSFLMHLNHDVAVHGV